MSIMLWLDDLRPAPVGWFWCRSVNTAITVMKAGGVAFVSLDHDLGEYAADGGDGHRFTDWMAEHGCWPTGGLRVHSSNPVGVRQMLATVDRYSGFTGYGSTRGERPNGGWPPAVV